MIIAPESAVTLSNQVFALTTQGVCSISDNGGPVISRPVENQINALEGLGFSALQYYSFGVGYESERQYVLWTISTPSDTYATQAFIYNTFTKCWTKSTRPQQHGIILSSDNKMYLANPTSNKISQERKSYTYTDYSDEAISLTVSAFLGLTVTVNDVSSVSVGDSLYQSASVNSIITAINAATHQVTVSASLTWSIGAVSLLKSIPCLMEWLPNTAGNPGYYRHWRESVLVFKQNYFMTANLGFYSEISSAIEYVPITGVSGQGWGAFIWGSQPWSGLVRSKPFRTYIPLEKQRCDLLSIQFKCQNVWAQFQIEGLSCILNTIGERVSN